MFNHFHGPLYLWYAVRCQPSLSCHVSERSLSIGHFNCDVDHQVEFGEAANHVIIGTSYCIEAKNCNVYWRDIVI